MQFRLLGALEASTGGTAVELGPPKQRALLAILLLHVGEIVSTDRLIELLWADEAPRTAAHSIQIYVSDLRKALEPLAGRRLITTRAPGYQLEVPVEEVDAKQFEALVAHGTAELNAGNREAAIAALQAALTLWRGAALSDFAYEEFAQPYLRRLNDLHLDAVETLASAQLDSGQATQVVPLLETAIREDPLRERSRELLMVALYRSGRHAEALRSYEKLRELLVEELGLEPSPTLQRLRDRVLLHDPGLLPATEPVPGARSSRNPYKGLQAFGEDDAQDFFGRDALLARLVESLTEGRRLVALVGPSGSGKSSAVAAGLIPRLRSQDGSGAVRWLIVPITLGSDPLTEVGEVLGRAAGAARPTAGRRTSEDLGLTVPSMPGGARPVLVIDHFEQLFTVAEESRRNQLLSALARELSGANGQLTVVLNLRADFYDRPLQHPEFSEVFVPGVIHVLPMSARELEAAIVGPAQGVGISIEPALLAELVAESVARPGSLPLLQYALTELFEQRSGPMLTLAGYGALGGLKGVLSRRAEAVFQALNADEQHRAMQVFLRLVRLGHGTADSRRRLMLSELMDLEVDSVALSDVLTSFGRHRLLTFDHDELTGEATVELAHEALLTEWERLAGWIDRHRTALRRRDALLAAVEEWELSGRDPDYLLAGGRLEEVGAWSREGTLQLTGRERDFLEAGLERRRAQDAEEAARLAAHQRLARSARLRLFAFAGAVIALAGAVAFAVIAAPPAVPRPIATAWIGSGQVQEQIVAGFDRGATEFDLVSHRFSMADLNAASIEAYGANWWDGKSAEEQDAKWTAIMHQELGRIADASGLVVVMNLAPSDLDAVAAKHPRTLFFGGDGVGQGVPNVAYAAFVQSEPSYLAGAAAALKTKTGTIGFIGGVDWEGIWGFQAGFEAGARWVRPGITILSEYLAPSFAEGDGFNDPRLARERALSMYAQGADIIFHAAGASGLGVFDAALRVESSEGRRVWAIGVDTDQYETIWDLVGAIDAEDWQPHILTSVLKPFSAMTYAAVADYVHGTFKPGAWKWGLSPDDPGISYSGGFLDAVRDRLEALKARIIAGEISVPCYPQEKEQAAIALGHTLNDCQAERPPT